MYDTKIEKIKYFSLKSYRDHEVSQLRLASKLFLLILPSLIAFLKKVMKPTMAELDSAESEWTAFAGYEPRWEEEGGEDVRCIHLLRGPKQHRNAQQSQGASFMMLTCSRFS